MLVERGSWAPASRSDEALAALGPELFSATSAETHAAALELATKPHRTVAGAAAQLRSLRTGLAGALEPLSIAAAVAGTHPLARAGEARVSEGARYQVLLSTLRGLAVREPTYALHVHVGVPDPALAMRAFNALRVHLPVLLALSANSPFWHGVDSGMASMRTPIFQGFPRAGLPRRFQDYGEYVEAIDLLVRSEAIPEPTFVWWDARLQPRFGTVEVRVMDAQSRVEDSAALAALVQCLVRLEALEGFAAPVLSAAQEVLDENRFLAARDGPEAKLIDPVGERMVPVRERVAALLEACEPHARELGCEHELAGIARLVAKGGAARQRAVAGPKPDLQRLLAALHAAFVERPNNPVRRRGKRRLSPFATAS
jgi:carboxylate-amine ligase